MLKKITQNISHYKETAALGLPVILAQLGQITVGIVDNIMVGNLGTTELAAASFANNIYNLAILFGMGFACIITPLVGASIGTGDHREGVKIFKNGLAAGVAVGLILTIGLTGVSFLFPYMGQPCDIVEPARNYFLIITVSTIPLMIFFSFKQYAEGMKDTKSGMYIVLMANVVNIAVNYSFMYGKNGAPELGFYGAAVGPLVARFFMAGAFFYVFTQDTRYSKYLGFYKQAKLSMNTLGVIFNKGTSLGAQIVMEASAFSLAGVMMGWVGKSALAAHQIAISMSMLGFMIYQGIGAATTIRVSGFAGEQKFAEAKRAASASTHLMIMLSVAVALAFYLSRNAIPYIFNSDPAVVAVAVQFLTVLAIYQLPDALQLSYSSATRGLADVKIPVVITFISYFCISLPASYLFTFVFDAGAVGIWIGLPVGLSASFILFYMRFGFMVKSMGLMKVMKP